MSVRWTWHIAGDAQSPSLSLYLSPSPSLHPSFLFSLSPLLSLSFSLSFFLYPSFSFFLFLSLSFSFFLFLSLLFFLYSSFSLSFSLSFFFFLSPSLFLSLSLSLSPSLSLLRSLLRFFLNPCLSLSHLWTFGMLGNLLVQMWGGSAHPRGRRSRRHVREPLLWKVEWGQWEGGLEQGSGSFQCKVPTKLVAQISNTQM